MGNDSANLVLKRVKIGKLEPTSCQLSLAKLLRGNYSWFDWILSLQAQSSYWYCACESNLRETDFKGTYIWISSWENLNVNPANHHISSKPRLNYSTFSWKPLLHITFFSTKHLHHPNPATQAHSPNFPQVPSPPSLSLIPNNPEWNAHKANSPLCPSPGRNVLLVLAGEIYDSS